MPDNDAAKPTPPPAKPEVKVTEVPTLEPKSTIVEVPVHMQHEQSGRKDETREGGMIVARVNHGKHFQVQDANGVPIPGLMFDPKKGEVVQG